MVETLIIPRPHTNAHKICEHIYEVGAMSKDDCLDWTVMHICSRKDTAYTTIAEARDKGLLVRTNDGLDLSDGMRKYFDAMQPQEPYKGKIASPRTPPVPRPLSPKYFISAEARRQDAGPSVQHAHYSSGTSPEPFRGEKLA